MRAGQTPLKIECFSIKENGLKEKIGYILLSVRCAQIVPRGKTVNVKMKWYNILGLKNDLKDCKPELLLSLRIEDRNAVSSVTTLKVLYIYLIRIITRL